MRSENFGYPPRRQALPRRWSSSLSSQFLLVDYMNQQSAFIFYSSPKWLVQKRGTYNPYFTTFIVWDFDPIVPIFFCAPVRSAPPDVRSPSSGGRPCGPLRPRVARCFGFGGAGVRTLDRGGSRSARRRETTFGDSGMEGHSCNGRATFDRDHLCRRGRGTALHAQPWVI